MAGYGCQCACGSDQPAICRPLASDSQRGNGLDVIPPHVNKASGLAYLQSHWQVTASQTAAFGDNGNDLEMLREADYSYAMQNAIMPVKQMATYLTPYDNNHDGVLAAIETLI